MFFEEKVVQNTAERKDVYGCITAQIVEYLEKRICPCSSRSVLDLSRRSLLRLARSLRARPPGGGEAERSWAVTAGFPCWRPDCGVINSYRGGDVDWLMGRRGGTQQAHRWMRN
jgi:hypothetical protein